MIAIPNMEKPSCCGLCQLCLNDSRIANGYCMFFHRTVNMMELDKACPLIEIDESEMEYLYREFVLEKDDNLTDRAKELKRAILMGYLYAKSIETQHTQDVESVGERRTDDKEIL